MACWCTVTGPWKQLAVHRLGDGHRDSDGVFERDSNGVCERLTIIHHCSISDVERLRISHRGSNGNANIDVHCDVDLRRKAMWRWPGPAACWCGCRECRALSSE